MGVNVIIAHKVREREALLRLARNIAEAADTRGRSLSRGEDGMVAELLRQARAVENEIASLRKDQKK